MTDLNAALTDTLLTICKIPSPIGEEKALCDHIEARLIPTLGRQAVVRFHDSLIVHATQRPGAPKIALVGHLDTVVTEHERPARVEGNKLYGAGSSDMKSGLAIMIELAERVDLQSLPYDLRLIFYEREEGPFAENRLGPILDEFDDLRTLDLAICLEPSDNEMQLGAMGSVHATAIFEGRTAHSARPWQGDNAFYKAASFLNDLDGRQPHDVELQGHVFREVITPTLMNGGRARNVVPDRCEINLNYRFAPGRTPEAAVSELRLLLGDRGRIDPTDLSPAGKPHAQNALVRHLASCGVTAVKTKQAWTDVARFDSVGVPGVNLGPGNSAQAHQKNEYTELDLLFAGYQIFEQFITTAPKTELG